MENNSCISHQDKHLQKLQTSPTSRTLYKVTEKRTSLLYGNDKKLGKIIILLPLRTISYSFTFFIVHIKIDNKSIFILKLTTSAFSFLALQVKTSILSVRFFMTIAKSNNGIILDQNTTLKVNWNIVGFNQQMLYLSYGNIAFLIVGEI